MVRRNCICQLANLSELVTEPVPANTEFDYKLAMKDRPRRISSSPCLPPEDSRILFYGSIRDCLKV